MLIERVRIAIVLVVALLVSVGSAPGASHGRFSGNLIGFISDQAGIPQMGASVFLYNSYDRLVGHALTNEKGAFGFDALLPGLYSVRVRLASFVPAIKNNIKIQPGMSSFLSVNMASVLSSVELIYNAPGKATIMNNDWKWVLRTSLPTRPILRMLPGVDISAPTDGQKPVTAIFSKTRGLVKISTGEQGSLAAAGAQTDMGTAFAMATSLFGGNDLQFSGNVGYASHTGAPAAGFRTRYSGDLWGATPEVSLTMRQVSLRARVGSAFLSGNQEGAPRLQTMTVSTMDRRQLTDHLLFEYGASLESVVFLDRLNYLSPFGRLTYDLGRLGSVEIAISSGMPPAELLSSSDDAQMDLQSNLTVLALFPRVSLWNGDARVQRTQSFELAYRKEIGSRSITAGVYRESVHNAAMMISAPAGYFPAGDLLPDLSSNASVFNIGRFDRVGYKAGFTQKLGDQFSFSLAGGNSGVLTPRAPMLKSNDPSELRNTWKQSRRNWLAAKFTGISHWTGTRFSAGYQWTDYGVLSPTHLYLTHGIQPETGLNFRVTQPLPIFGIWSGRVEATAEVRNLLKQGYVPITTADGRTLYMIQNPRAVRGGLSFIF